MQPRRHRSTGCYLPIDFARVKQLFFGQTCIRRENYFAPAVFLNMIRLRAPDTTPALAKSTYGDTPREPSSSSQNRVAVGLPPFPAAMRGVSHQQGASEDRYTYGDRI